jgi:hypothetical protein
MAAAAALLVAVPRTDEDGGCEERASLFGDAFWAIDQLDVQVPFPVHVRCF